jgi:uncharacterized protein YndB with AHSA1/START domain
MKHDPIVIEETINAPVEKVWQAITDKNKMKQWYFDLKQFNPAVGFEFRFSGTGRQGEKYMHRCRVTEVVENKKLQYSWQYENLNGYSLVTFELFKEGKQTRVKLTHEGLETFPQNNPDFALESFAGAWTHIMSKLEHYMSTQINIAKN